MSTQKHIHLIGICGTAMASLAGLLKQRGFKVTGSDNAVYPPMSTFLANLSIPVQQPYAEANLKPRPDLVVVGNAISRGNPEVEYVLNERIPFQSMAQVLHEYFITGRESLVVAGTTGDRLSAVEGRRIDATILTASELPRARKQGLVEIYDLAKMGVEVQGNGFATSRSLIKSQRDTALSALKGYVEAIHFIHRHRDESQKIVAKYLRLNDREVLDATYDAFVRTVSKRPYPTLKGIQFLLDEIAAKIPAAKSAKPEQFVDLSLLQQLEAEGFFSQMAKRYP